MVKGRALLDGLRRGIGAHNALWVPAGALFSMDMGRQSMGQAVLIPQGTPLRLPEMPRHLRIRDVTTQSELTALIEAAQREQSQQRPLRQDALEAHAALISVWLRRQIMQDEHVPDRRNAAGRLSQRYCNLLSERVIRPGPAWQAYADELGVTSTHLTRAVKSATGKTAADLLDRTGAACRAQSAARDHRAGQRHRTAPRVWLSSLFYPLYSAPYRACHPASCGKALTKTQTKMSDFQKLISNVVFRMMSMS